MNEVIEYNKDRWDELSEEGVEFARPWLDLTPETARSKIDPEGMLSEISGKNVLLLAGGGGQQSAAFGLLGANVTVLDFSKNQLEADKQVARHYSLDITLVERDMQDLSCFSDKSFDIVWQAHSLNFVPDARIVFREISRIICNKGIYRLSTRNPFFSEDERSWTGEGYLFNKEYIDGSELNADPYEIWGEYGERETPKIVKGPRKFCHSLSTLVNSPLEYGFNLLGLWEEDLGDINATPGTWSHFTAILPPHIVFLWQMSDKT